MDRDRVEGSVRNVAGKAGNAVGRAAGDTRTQAEGLYEQAAGAVQNTYGRAKDAARDIAEGAPDYVDRALETGERYYQDSSAMVRRQIEQQPITALVFAGALGYFVAWLIHSGRRY